MSELSLSTPHARRATLPLGRVGTAWVAASLVLACLWAAGISIRGDGDDLLKAVEIRHLLASGDIFDRTLPGILQPEPYVSHWPWLVDAPYALFAALLRPLLGAEAALQLSFLAVPLLLLLSLLHCLSDIVDRLAFSRPDFAFLVALAVSFQAIGEFQPGRIDYHNLQMLALAAALRLLLSPGPGSALLGGLVTALAFATGLELAAFFALVMGVHAWDFVFGEDRTGARLQRYGASLALSAAALFLLVTPPENYTVVAIDRYGLPTALALAAAGLSFAVAPMVIRRPGRLPRALFLLAAGAITAATLTLLFPEILGGPYGELPRYIREGWLGHIDQEKSIFARGDTVLSPAIVPIALMLVGALAPLSAVRRFGLEDRCWVLVALFGLLAAVQALALMRYFRFASLLAGPGFAYALVSLLAKAEAAGRLRPAALVPLLPGVGLAAALVLFHAMRGVPQEMPPAADVAAMCDPGSGIPAHWPFEARVLVPPLLGAQILAGSDATVTAIAFHKAAPGIERSLRFFDPATAQPETYAAAAKATHVALCAWHGEPSAGLRGEMPFTATLMEGRPPAWLAECPQPPGSPLRIYRLEGAPACPG